MTIQIEHTHTEEGGLEVARRQASEYAMALDLLGKISRTETEGEAIGSILEIFTALFAPEKLSLIVLREGSWGEIYPSSLPSQDKEALRRRVSRLGEKDDWAESEEGFTIKIFNQKKVTGIVDVQNILFPVYKSHYLNLALSIVDICGLVIENARKTEQLKTSEYNLRQEKERAEQALAEVETLSGLLPICMHCKKIRDDSGYWNQLETYIQQHSKVMFSHGICQECVTKYYPEEDL